MGETTDFVGHIDITPALNQDEIEYLTAFAATRHWDRPEGPYAVPGNPYAEELPSAQDEPRVNLLGPGKPQLYCQWTPCWDGCCLSFDGREKFYQPVPWLRYLVAHFLKRGATASRSGLAQFEHFTFDHALQGTVVGCRRDSKELFAITANGSRITSKVLRAGDRSYWDRPPLPSEIEMDRQQVAYGRRRRSPVGMDSSDGDGAVVDLASRRAGG